MLKGVLPGTQQGLSDAVLFQQYVDLVHAINEMCKDVRTTTRNILCDDIYTTSRVICMQGIIELVDPKAIERAMNLKVSDQFPLPFIYMFFEKNIHIYCVDGVVQIWSAAVPNKWHIERAREEIYIKRNQIISIKTIHNSIMVYEYFCKMTIYQQYLLVTCCPHQDHAFCFSLQHLHAASHPTSLA